MQQIQGASITSIGEQNETIENMVFTYDENEQQEIKIAKNNAKLLFKPKNVAFYFELLDYGLSLLTILVYGFIDFYLSNNREGKFYFTNEQLAELFKVSTVTISKAITELEQGGFIKTNYRIKGGGGRVRFVELLRKISLFPTLNNLTLDVKNFNGKENKKKENNINILATSNEVAPTKSKRFIKPTIEEITAYCKERNNTIDPHRFFDSYESKGWLIGKSPMKDWKACVRTWEKNTKDNYTRPAETINENVIF